MAAHPALPPRKQYFLGVCIGVLLFVFYNSILSSATVRNVLPISRPESAKRPSNQDSVHAYTSTTQVTTTVFATITETTSIAAPTPEPWSFDVEREERNYSLTNEQCNEAFPKLWKELDRALETRRLNEEPKITEADIDLEGHGSGFIRVMMYDRQIYITDVRWGAIEYDLPRALALLHSMNRAIVVSQEPIPNIEFSIALKDKFDDSDGKFPAWVLARRRNEEEYRWVMPDFGYWSWTLNVVGGYTDIRNQIRENEPAWEDKIPKALWRGDTGPNPIRPLLIKAAEGKEWSDVKKVGWKDSAHVSEGDREASVSIPDHCFWQFLIHTEGNSYSGRGKHLLNCQSVSIVHDPEWIEPHTHLFIDDGEDQNIVSVLRDFSDLNDQMTSLLNDPDKAQLIVSNSIKTFRDRYLTPAAMACYWRRMFQAWSEVSFEPELYVDAEDGPDGRRRRRTRGKEYETFVADFVNAPSMD